MRFVLLTTLLIFVTQSLATDISNVPIESQSVAKPNLIFALDDSGSMDFEVLLDANDGGMWWSLYDESFTDDNGVPYFNPTGTYGWDGTKNWLRYGYLFPNGYSSDTRKYNDWLIRAIPPTPEFAFFRSSDYNRIYYNPMRDYGPWPEAHLNGQVSQFSNANPTNARSHPVFPTSGTANTMDLTQLQQSTSSSYTFRIYKGMKLPGHLISGVRIKSGWSWSDVNYDYTESSTWGRDAVIPYYPATYYMKDESCVGNELICPTAPDGSKLKRYEIKPGIVFPSGRSYTDELQNFANWFKYYRKRGLLMSSALGRVLPQISGIRAGIVKFKTLDAITMKDFDAEQPQDNAKSVLGVIFGNSLGGGTPTREALKHIGEQYRNNDTIIQHACQVNAAMILTDGYATSSAVSVPSYSPATWGNTAPYTQTHSSSLADLALAYYTLNLRPELTTGKVPIDPAEGVVNPDLNPNLHMNTYAFTMGTKGTIYGVNTQQTNDPFTYSPIWPAPNETGNPNAVDDLWHATINGRGLIFDSVDPNAIVASLQTVFDSVLERSGSAVGLSTIYPNSMDNQVFSGSYSNNTGDLESYMVDLSNGTVSMGSPMWSAQSLLDQKNHTTRFIATYDGSTGIPFQWDSLDTFMQNQLHSDSTSDGQLVLNYLRGDKSNEGSTYRSRSHLLGDIVHSEPVYVKGAMAKYTDQDYLTFKNSVASRTPMVYVGANDGMLHAFNANSGEEAWAYVPKLVFENLNDLTKQNYSHKFYVDATPVAADIKINSTWKTILVGGLRAGGKGFYAIDITSPTLTSESTLANKILWEFPNDNTPDSIKNNIGFSYGKPIIAKTEAYGWVVLVSSGYNTTNGDGKGRLFILNPADGSVIRHLETTQHPAGLAAGLGQITAYTTNPQINPMTDFVYGGDLNGSIWRFDLTGNNIDLWNVNLLANLVDAQDNPQPITSKIEIAQTATDRLVFVGTGKLLGLSDLDTSNQNSFYAIIDDLSTNPTIQNIRNNLQQRIITNGSNSQGEAVDYSVKKGWYMDFPASGERYIASSTIAFGLVTFNTNLPSPNACQASSYQYLIDYTNGLELTSEDFGEETPWARRLNNTDFASKPVLIMLPNGTMVALTQNADTTLNTQSIPIPSIAPSKKVAWKEIINQ